MENKILCKLKQANNTQQATVYLVKRLSLSYETIAGRQAMRHNLSLGHDVAHICVHTLNQKLRKRKLQWWSKYTKYEYSDNHWQ